MAGLESTGFDEKTLDEIKTEIENELKAEIDPGINVLATSLFGQLIGVFSGKLRELWEVALAVYNALYPDSASGAALDGVAAITGATRLAATKSQVSLDLNLDNGTTVPSGSVVSVGAEGARFVTKAAASNATGHVDLVSVDAESEDYGAIAGNAGAIDTIQTPISGWSSAPAVKSGNTETFDLDDGQTLLVKVDGGSEQTATFNTGDFADIDNATAAEIAAVINTDITGATAEDAGGKVWIETDTEGTGGSIQVTGGTANAAIGFGTDLVEGMNRQDAEPGREEETDAAFRLRREQLLRVAGAATVEAIRADLLALDGVADATVYENVTMVTDGDGVPAKAFESVVLEQAGGGSGYSASVVNANAETYDLDDGQTLTVKVDDGAVQTATFNTGDFSDIDNATAAEVAAVINTDVTGVTAEAVSVGPDTFVNIKTDSAGTTSKIEVTGGTANTALGFPTSELTSNDQEIAETIFESKAAGIEAHGAINVIVEDTQGIAHLIGSTRPTPKAIYVEVFATVDSDDYPADGDAQIQAQVVAYGATLSDGDDVIHSRIYDYVYNVAGIIDVTNIEIGFSDPPTASVNLVIGSREISTWDTGDVDVYAT